jgi:hypothetical protein
MKWELHHIRFDRIAIVTKITPPSNRIKDKIEYPKDKMVPNRDGILNICSISKKHK